MAHLCKEELPFESQARLIAGAADDPVAQVLVPSLSRLFDVCAAVVVGQCTNAAPKRPEKSLSLEEVFQDLLGSLKVPVLLGAPFGHGPRKATYPLGARALVDGDEARLYLTESGVC